METLNSFLHKNRMTIRGMMVGFIILLLMIPIVQISELVREREGRHQQHGKAVDPRQEQIEELARGRVDPVQILEDQ